MFAKSTASGLWFEVLDIVHGITDGNICNRNDEALELKMLGRSLMFE